MGVTIRITPTAWMKMETLVMGYDKEVGWFGTCEQVGPLDFRIKDILIFPQYTSGCFVDDERDDPLEFRNWLNTLTDEEYEQRRLWGHSHVNMGTTPSGVDTSMFERFAKSSCAALVNRFAICVILNKRSDMYWWAYDGETDKEYKKDEISVMIEVDDKGTTNLEYFEGSKSLVRDIRSTTEFLYNRGSYYSGYYNKSYYNDPHKAVEAYNYGGHNSYVADRNKTTKEEEKKTETKKVEPEIVSLPQTKTTKNPYNDKWFNEYYEDWADAYGDEYYGYGESSVAGYDVEITKDSIEVFEVYNDSIFDYKNDFILEDEISTLPFRFTVTEEELVSNHPINGDTVIGMLIDACVTKDIDCFSVWEEGSDENHVTAYSPEDDKSALNMLLAKVNTVNLAENNVLEISVGEVKDQSNDERKGGVA